MGNEYEYEPGRTCLSSRYKGRLGLLDIEVIIEKIENELYTGQLLEEFISETVFHTDLVYAYLNPVIRQCFKKSNILYKKNLNKEMK